jgi:hypothetical protein
MDNRQPLSELAISLPERIDVFVCNASFEDRCRSIASHLDYTRIEKTLLYYNTESEAMFAENLGQLRNLVGENRMEIPLSREQPLKTIDGLLDSIRFLKKERPMSYVIDITSFTHETLLMLLKVLALSTSNQDSVTLLYSPAEKYAPWLTKGITDIRAVLGYPGLVFPYRRTHLLLLVGHEWERALKLIQKLEAAVVTLGVGRAEDSISSSHYKTNIKHFDRLRAIYRGVRSFEFSCNDPLKTSAAIAAEVEAVGGDYDTIISPMNTKLSTVGAALAAFHDPKLQLCYAQASLYNTTNYSIPGGDFYQCDFWDLMR